MLEEKKTTKTISYEFDGFHLSGPLKELRRGEETVDVQRRVLDLLFFLLENRDRTVAKDEIQDAVWPGTIVTEAALTRAVMKARRALNDDASTQQFIKTVHGQGYRFVSAVREVSSDLVGQVSEKRGSRRQSLLRIATTYGAGAWLINQAAAMVWEAFEWTRWPQQLLLGISLLGFPVVLAFAWFYRATPSGIALRSERQRGSMPTTTTTTATRERTVIGTLILALILSIGWNLREEIEPDLIMDKVVVLPMINNTGQQELSWLSLGMLGLLNAQLAEAQISVLSAPLVLRQIPEPVADVSNDLLEQLRLTQGARFVVNVSIAGAGAEYRADGYYFDASTRFNLPSFTGESPSAAVRSLGHHLIGMLNPSLTLSNIAYASGDLFVDQAFARGMHELLSGNTERARDLLQVAVNARPDAFAPNYELASALRTLGDLDEARRQDLRLLADAKVSEDALQVAMLSNELGVVSDLAGDLQQSEAHYTEGIRWASEAGLHERRAVLLINYAILERARANPLAARELLGSALTAYQDAGIELLPGDFYITVGNAAADAGDFAGAKTQYRQALNNFQAMNRSRGEGVALANLSWVSEQLGDIPASFQYLEQSAALRARIGDRVGVVRSKVRRADLLYGVGRLDEALDIVDEVTAHEYTQTEKEILTTMLRFRAAIASDRGAFEDARGFYEQAMAIDQQEGRVAAENASRLGVARSMFGVGDYRGARKFLDQVLQAANDSSLSNLKLEARQLEAQLYRAESDSTAAIQVLKSAADEARTQANKLGLAMVAADLADLYFSLRDLESLQAWVGVAIDAQAEHGRVKLAEAKLALLKGDAARVQRLVAESRALMGERVEREASALLSSSPGAAF